MKLNIVVTVMMAIIVVIVIFSILGNTSAELQIAGDEAGYLNNCSEIGQIYNRDVSTVNCTLNGVDSGEVAGFYDLPLQSLLRSGGVAFMALMAAAILFFVVIAKKVKS